MASVPGTDAPGAEAKVAATPAAGAARSTPKRFGWLRGRRVAMVIAVALAATGIGFGSVWFGFAAMLPLLYFLPCAAMLYFCRKG